MIRAWVLGAYGYAWEEEEIKKKQNSVVSLMSTEY